MGLPYTESAEAVLKTAERESKKLKHYYIGSEHILLGLLKEPDGVAGTVLRSQAIDIEAVYDLISDLTLQGKGTILKERAGMSPRTERILEDAETLAEKYHSGTVGTEHILLAIIREGNNCAVQILLALRKNPTEIYIQTLMAMGEDPQSAKEDFKKTKQKKKDTFLENYSKDLTALAAKGKLDPVVGREDEITRVVQILSRRTKNNPCLVGEPGVGKTAIVEGLATRIAAGNVPETVLGKRVLTLDLSGMVAGTKYRGEFEERMKRLLSEVTEAGDIILFLDEIHTLIGAGGSEGSIDAANILKPSLSRGEIQLIGATTLTEYRKYVEKDAALERRFQPVDVSEPTEEEAVRILQGIAYKYEEHHHVKYTTEALDTAVRLSSRYINDRHLPDKAIDLIDEAGALVRLKSLKHSDKIDEYKEEIQKLDLQIARSIKIEAFTQAAELREKQRSLQSKLKKLEDKERADREKNLAEVNENHIADVVAVWTKVPVKKLTEKESDRLLKLESILHKRVIGQEDAVVKISKAMRRQRVGLQDPNRPIGSFLFLGPTGVGKTELSKALAEAMFGDENALIRVDMSEYMESHSVSKMIGSPPGYVGFDDGGQLSEKVRRNPYSVVLFDEVEKAHPDVFNILLQVLDDGHITDSKGRKVNFKNTIIIMTSNAGAARIVEPKNLGFATKSDEKRDYDNMKNNVMDEVKKIFKPEFINRIDDIVVFRALNKKDMGEIVTLLSKKLISRCKEQMDIKLTISPLLKTYIVDKFTDTKMGARPIKRAIQSEIEDKLSEQILRKDIVPGDTVTATRKNNETVFVKKEVK
ncbi:ATP-dependent Clp protease ATP-binding subunit ClpC [Lachnospiraceae bacterium YSD2013]|nr:ATP-dependent Clp protease ATP-binding subunit ClpC [Lachnospiraceae bacterium YSD2013]